MNLYLVASWGILGGAVELFLFPGPHEEVGGEGGRRVSDHHMNPHLAALSRHLCYICWRCCQGAIDLTTEEALFLDVLAIDIRA